MEVSLRLRMQRDFLIHLLTWFLALYAVFQGDSEELIVREDICVYATRYCVRGVICLMNSQFLCFQRMFNQTAKNLSREQEIFSRRYLKNVL